VSAVDLLWNDTGLYQKRYEKTATALVAIAQALERNQPLRGGEAEFLELYNRMASADPDAFTEVWRDPTVYFWIRLAYEFVGNCLTPGPTSALAKRVARAHGATDAKSALQSHLNQFKRYVLALGVITGTDQQFHMPLEVALPFALPSSRIVVAGEGSISIEALIDGHLEVLHLGKRLRLRMTPASVESLEIRESPVAVVDGYSLMLQPEALNLAGLQEGELLRTVPPSFQQKHVGLVTDALGLLSHHTPETFAHFREVVRLIALKPDEIGDYSNISHSDLPGSFVITVAADPYMMADFFTHEFYHNRFFFVEELGAFFANDDDNLVQPAQYYSPFREDLRPLHGIFHGLYVYLAVWRFWYAVVTSGQTSGLRAPAAAEQLAGTAIRAAIAAGQLRRFARFSLRGAELFEAMGAECARDQQMTRALNLPPDLPSIRCDADGTYSLRLEEGTGQPLSLRKVILNHAETYDTQRQCGDLESIIRASLGA
jgi:HEXXH motif-containing protein